MYCTNCGNKIDIEDKFCAACGHEKKDVIVDKKSEDKIDIEKTNKTKSNNNKINNREVINPITTNDKKNSSKKNLIYSVVIFFCILAIGAIVYSMNRGKYEVNKLSEESTIDIEDKSKDLKNDSEITKNESKPNKEKTQIVKQGLFPIHVDDKFGYMDGTGNIVIEPMFYEFYGIEGRYNSGNMDDYNFHEGLSCVGIKEGNTIKYGYINTNGEFAIAPIYDDARNFYDGLASVTIGDKKGFINKKGEMVFDHEFDNGYNYSDGLAYFEKFTPEDKENRYTTGFIDKKGEIVIKDTRQYNIKMFEEGYLGTGYDNKFIDKNGNDHIVPEDYIIYSGFSEGLAVISQGGKFGFINKKGEIEIWPLFENAKVFSEGLAAVQVNGKWGFINRDGSFVISCEYDFVFNFSDGMAAFSNKEDSGEDYQRDDHRLGFINKEGTVVLEPQFPIELTLLQRGDYRMIPNMYQFKNGLAYVPIDGVKKHDKPIRRKWGYINKNGELVWSEELE